MNLTIRLFSVPLSLISLNSLIFTSSLAQTFTTLFILSLFSLELFLSGMKIHLVL